MFKEFISVFIKKGFISWVSRLGVILITGITFDQVGTRFGVDFVNKLSIDIWHYIFICIILSLLAELWINHQNIKNTPVDDCNISPSHDFTKAVLMYIGYLKSTGRNASVVDLRNKITHLFHLLGLHKSREKLGEIAFGSSVAINDIYSKAEILIDDLGWCLHLQGRSQEAITNIKKAISILKNSSFDTDATLVHSSLISAKAFRHLAMLSMNEKTQAKYLKESFLLIFQLKKQKQIMKSFEVKIVCDEAQVYHAKAFLTARNLGLHNEGQIQFSDKNNETKIRNALSETKKAVALFVKIVDLERESKALFLLERLHDSLNEKIEALEVKAHRETVLSRSGIDGSLSTIAIAQAKIA